MAHNTNTTTTTTTTTDAAKARIALTAANVATAGLTDEQCIEAARWLGKSYAHADEKLRSAVRGQAPRRFVAIFDALSAMAAESAATGKPSTATCAEFGAATGKARDITPATLRLQYGKMRGYLGDIDGATVDIDKTTGTVTVSAQ